MGGLLCITRKKMISEFLERRDVIFVNSETNVKTTMKQDYFEIAALR
jgi:hypothetical protein